MDNLLSTKFIGTIVVVTMAYALVWAGKLDAVQWLNMAVVGVGIYSGANVAQKFVVKK